MLFVREKVVGGEAEAAVPPGVAAVVQEDEPAAGPPCSARELKVVVPAHLQNPTQWLR